MKTDKTQMQIYSIRYDNLMRQTTEGNQKHSRAREPEGKQTLRTEWQPGVEELHRGEKSLMD